MSILDKLMLGLVVAFSYMLMSPLVVGYIGDDIYLHVDILFNVLPAGILIGFPIVLVRHAFWGY